MNVTIYTSKNCSYCNSAKVLLASRHISFTEMVLDVDFTKENLMELFPNARSFPVIVVDGMNIGGFDQLKEMLDTNSDARKLLNEG